MNIFIIILCYFPQEASFGGLFGSNGDSGIVSASLTSGAGGAIADLLDLQSELSSLQKGLTEISQQRAQQNQKVLLVWHRCIGMVDEESTFLLHRYVVYPFTSKRMLFERARLTYWV